MNISSLGIASIISVCLEPSWERVTPHEAVCTAFSKIGELALADGAVANPPILRSSIHMHLVIDPVIMLRDLTTSGHSAGDWGIFYISNAAVAKQVEKLVEEVFWLMLKHHDVMTEVTLRYTAPSIELSQHQVVALHKLAQGAE
jgi:hypothetical protein